jgi:peroxiredoxin
MSENLQSAPDFELTDVTGKSIRLFQFRGSKNVLLVFLRGFL